MALFDEKDMEKEVYMASDAEGNDYSKLADASDQIKVAREGGEVDIYNTDEPEEYEGEKTEEVIVLWRV